MEDEEKVVRTEKELGEALKNGRDELIIEGDLKNKALKIRATGKVAWAVAIAAISAAVVIFVGTGGTGAPASGIIGVGATAVLGTSTAIAAVSIAVAAGGVGALNSLRKYKEISRDGNRLILRKK